METVETSLIDVTGAFHFVFAATIVVCIIALTILQTRSDWFQRRNPLLLFGIAVFIWGDAASNFGATTFHVTRSHGGGFDPSMTQHNLATIAAIQTIYSFVAALAVLLSLVLRLTRKTDEC